MKKSFIKKTIYVTLGLMVCTIALSAQTITLDAYFNKETKKDKTGKEYSFHYLWEDKQGSGFSIFGEAFKAEGAKSLTLLNTSPRDGKLSGTDVYIIVDPDTEKESPAPNYIEEKDAQAVLAWVKQGGVLLLLGNDAQNTDLEHLNLLSSKFGITFKGNIILHVINDEHFSEGGLNTEGNPLFPTAKNIFIKDAAPIQLEKSAQALLADKNGATVIATTKYGKGTVLAVGDPWLYNEYTNGRLPAVYENDKAARDIAKWLISKIPKK